MNQPYKPRQKKRFHNKTQAFQMAIKVWTCKSCGVQHKKDKPKNCISCGFNDFYYFASVFEANRYAELKLQQTTGYIKNLQTQVAYPIKHNGVLICKYIADFQYHNLAGDLVVEDTKGHEKGVSDLFKLKRKLVGAFHGIDVKPIYQNYSGRK